MLLWFNSLFAWREVRDTGVWTYMENTITGERKAHDKGGCYQPIDWNWLGVKGRAITRTGNTLRHPDYLGLLS